MKKLLITFWAITVVILLAGVSYKAIARQNLPPGRDYYWQYSNRTESLFKAAAYVYYNNQGVLGRVNCMPQDVVIDYGTINENWTAWAWPYGAYRDEYPDGSNKYCRVFWNTNYWPENRRAACVTFIHEYGHLLGRDHNNNIKSPMYDGYDKYAGDKREALYNRRNKNVLARSVCDALEIRK